MTPENKALMDRYPQYYRDVSHLEVIDVYRVIDLFNVTDATAQHALKKLLLSGQRTGGKPIEVDLKEARDTLSRGLAMRAEDANKHQLGFDFAAPGNTSVTIVNRSGDPVPPLSEEVLKHVIGHGASLSLGTTPDIQHIESLLKSLDYMQPPLTDGECEAVAGMVHERLNPLPPTLRYCGYAGCEMRVRDDNSDRCMIHSKPGDRPAVVDKMCAEPNCVMPPAKGAIRCAEHCAPPLNRSAGAMPRRTR